MISWNMKEHANFTISFIFIKYEKYFQIDIEHTKWKILSVLVNITYYEIFHNLKEYFIFTQSVILFQNDKNTDEFEKLQYFSFSWKYNNMEDWSKLQNISNWINSWNIAILNGFDYLSKWKIL